MTRAELLKKLQYWASDEVYLKFIRVIESLDYVFGLTEQGTRALMINHGGTEWNEFRSFYKALTQWKQDPEFDIITTMANNIPWFQMITKTEVTRFMTRLTLISDALDMKLDILYKSLDVYREYLSEFATTFYTMHPNIDTYRKYCFELNPTFTIQEAQEFYQSIMTATVRYILYGKLDVEYILKEKGKYGGIIDIRKFIMCDENPPLGYIITHNVRCFANMALNHDLRLYEWLIES